jgi:uroporphyrinogen III methyltransferase / synthase
VVACIGPQTAATAREFGLRVDVEPEVAQVQALVDALAAYADQLRDSGQTVPPSRRSKSKGRAAR